MQLGPHLRLRLLRTVEYTKLPRPRRHVPRFYPGDGAGPLRATLLLRLHSHCGPKGRPEALVPPPCTGETREENFPSRVVIVGDEGTLTRQNISSCLSANPRPKDVARGFVLDPLTLDRDHNSISQPIRDRLGCMSQCVCLPHRIPKPEDTALRSMPYKQLPQAHGLSTTLLPL